ncbi:STAS-like domain-containing protein [Pseudomonas oryzihabitans]|uniref:STAS-like domain-containing protein n=1 Tax=Pseudomonas oryzihabitans TaxID=47885 RepID=UPI003F9C14D8
MITQVRLAIGSDTIRTLGMRSSAIPFRKEIERDLSSGNTISVDFQGHDATQSFVDELVGALVLKYGRPVLTKLSFKNCSDDVRSIIKFVVSDRLQQIEQVKATA